MASPASQKFRTRITAAAVQASSLTQARVGERPHALAVAGEMDQRNDGERQLHAEDHLAQDAADLERALLAGRSRW